MATARGGVTAPDIFTKRADPGTLDRRAQVRPFEQLEPQVFESFQPVALCREEQFALVAASDRDLVCAGVEQTTQANGELTLAVLVQSSDQLAEIGKRYLRSDNADEHESLHCKSL